MEPVTDKPARGTQIILRTLRVSLHVSFALLLLIGIIRFAVSTTASSALAPCVWPGVLVLAVVYLGGTFAEQRFSLGRSGFDPKPWALLWLGVVTVIWVALASASMEFAWLVFPLYFLQLHLLPRLGGVLAVAVTMLLCSGLLLMHAGAFQDPHKFSYALLLGPFFGAAFAVVTALSYQALYREAEIQRRLVAEVVAARAELAESHVHAGVLQERTRLARDIHDTLAQSLSSVVLMSRATDRSLAAGDLAQARERLAVVEETASAALGQARDFVRGGSSEQAGPVVAGPLSDTLRELVDGTGRQARARGEALTVGFDVVGAEEPVDAQLREALTRATQSLLANVLRHARAAHAMVTLSFLGNQVALDVFDDGIGFDPALTRTTPEGGLGLGLLRERISALGGEVTLESAPGEGVVVGVRVPMRRAEA